MSSDLVVIELAGTPGAGKTTVAAAVVQALRTRDLDASSVVAAARPHARRTAVGRIVAKIPHTRVRELSLWYVFYLGSMAHGLAFAIGHRRLVRHVVRAGRARHAAGDAVGRTHATYWFLQLCGRVAFLRATARPGQILVIDDGFLHRAVHLHASTRGTVDRAAVGDYTSLVPAPDLLIRLEVPDELCHVRVRRRGIWAHARHLDDAQLAAYLGSARGAVEEATARAERLGWRTVTIENHGRGVADVVCEVMGALESPANVDAHRHDTQGRGRERLLHVPRPSRVRALAAGRFGAPALAPECVRAVLERYGLPSVSDTYSDLRVGRRSLNAAVATPFGTKVVKQYRPQWTEALVEYGHSVIEHLEQQSFPAVRLSRTPAGGTHVVLDGSVYAVFDFVEGTSYSLNYLRRADRLALARTAGRTLARMHNELDGFVPLGVHHLGFTAPEGARARDVAWHTRRLDGLVARSRADLPVEAAEPARSLIARVETTLETLAALERTLAPVGLPRLVVHGDFGLHNLLFPSPDRAVVVDFESARLDWRINDLVSALGKYRRRDRRYDVESMETFLRAYTECFPLTAVECELFAEVWQLYRTRAAVQYWNSYFETSGPTRKLWSALDALDQAEWAAGRPELLAHLVRTASAQTIRERAS
ncbi:MAG TPA: phosphotransferase [Acidimicrobiia bacterium]